MNGINLIYLGGLPSEAYYALTGAPTFFYSLVNSNEKYPQLWKTLIEGYNKNYCIDFGTPVDVDQSKWLKPNHAYTMVYFQLFLDCSFLNSNN